MYTCQLNDLRLKCVQQLKLFLILCTNATPPGPDSSYSKCCENAPPTPAGSANRAGTVRMYDGTSALHILSLMRLWKQPNLSAIMITKILSNSAARSVSENDRFCASSVGLWLQLRRSGDRTISPGLFFLLRCASQVGVKCGNLKIPRVILARWALVANSASGLFHTGCFAVQVNGAVSLRYRAQRMTDARSNSTKLPVLSLLFVNRALCVH